MDAFVSHGAAAIHAEARATDIEPGSLLTYDGCPSSINETYSTALAALALAQSDHVVLGAGLEKATQPDHDNTVDILAGSAMSDVVVLGYIDLGVSTSAFTMTDTQTRVDEQLNRGLSSFLIIRGTCRGLPGSFGRRGDC